MKHFVPLLDSKSKDSMGPGTSPGCSELHSAYNVLFDIPHNNAGLTHTKGLFSTSTLSTDKSESN